MAVHAKVAILSVEDDAATAFINHWTCDEDSEYACRRRRAGDRKRSLAGRALLRFLLSNFFDRPADSWTFLLTAEGKPYLSVQSGEDRPGISISHSSAIVAAAMTLNGDIGIDVERRKNTRSMAAIARFAFGPREIEEAISSVDAFYHIWTLREALAKASGVGLLGAANGKDCVAGSPAGGAWIARLDDRWQYLSSFCMEPDYSIALAIRTQAGAAKEAWGVGSIDIQNMVGPDTGPFGYQGTAV